ncbi:MULTISPECIES: TPM domain-containing protein [Tsukamurella]|nr:MULTISPECIES: TPM domain-containing protein [Tsukamurella]NMD57060.1 TPM domain-containing protein [Tsukamurella columbiensis]
MNRIFGIVCVLIVALTAGVGTAAADPTGVADRAGLFGDRAGDVGAALDDFQLRTGMTGTVVTANGIGGQDIRAFATGAGAVLGRDRGEAVVIAVDVQTRKVGVYTTPTAMTRIPDAEITRVIDTAITPPFRAGNYANGVIAGLRGLADVATGLAVATTTAAVATTPDDAVVLAPGLAGGTTYNPGDGGIYGSYPGSSPHWQSPATQNSGIPGVIIAIFVLVAIGIVVSIVTKLGAAANADTPELRSRLAAVIDDEPGYATWSNRKRYAHAHRHTGVGLVTWNSIYPQWHVRESETGSSSSGGVFGGGGSSSSFASDSGSSGPSSSSSSGGFSDGGGSSGSF